MPNEELLEAERRRVRDEYEKEMEDIRQKFKTEQQSKAKMQEEVKQIFPSSFLWNFKLVFKDCSHLFS